MLAPALTPSNSTAPKISLAQRRAVVAEDVVGRGGVEEEVRQIAVRTLSYGGRCLRSMRVSLFIKKKARDDIAGFLQPDARCSEALKLQRDNEAASGASIKMRMPEAWNAGRA